MSLITQTDLEDRLGRELTADEEARWEALADDVSAAVQLYTGQTFEAGEHTFRVRPRGDFVRLPQRPVTSVDTVEDIDGNTVTHTFDGIDRVYLTCHGLNQIDWEWAPAPRVVDITYTAGPEAVPAVIVGLVCSIVLRSLGVDPTEGAVTREAIDGYSYTIGATGGAGPYGVFPQEQAILDSFRRQLGTIYTR